MVSVLAYVPAAFAYGCKMYTCVSAANKIRVLVNTQETENSPTNGGISKKTARITINAVTAIAQGVDLLADFAPPPVQLVTKIVIGAVDTLGTIGEKAMQEDEVGIMDMMDVATTVAFRATDALHFTMKAFPYWRQEQKITVQGIRTTAALLSIIKKNINKNELVQIRRIPLVFAQDPVLSKYKCPIAKTPIRFLCVVIGTEENEEPVFYEKREIVQWIKNRKRETPPGWPAGIPVEKESLTILDAVQQRIDTRLKFLLEQRRLPLEERDVFEVMHASGIEDFPCVPSLFLDDKILGQYLCSIHKKPMRFVLVVKGTENEAIPVCYERAAITKWMAETPGELPPRWPNAVPFERTELLSWKPVQTLLNKRLNFLLKETKRTGDEREDAATQVGNFSAATTDPSIIDANTTIEELQSIPEEFLWHEIPKQYICPIQEKPIRFVLVVRGTELEDEPVYYEKSAIAQWIQENPAKKPPKWPDRIPLKAENLVPWKPVQTVIDRTLRYLLEMEMHLLSL